MIIKAATLEAIRTSFSKLFEQGKTAAKSQWKRIATYVKSNAASNTYGWLGKFPRLREWVGARVVKDMKEHAYEISNVKYEGTVGVDRADIERDNLGTYRPIVLAMGQEANDHVDRNVFALLAAGLTALCYDGQPFFDTEHPVYAEHDGTGAATLVSNIINPLVTAGPAWYLLATGMVLKPFIFQEEREPEFQSIIDPKQDTVFMLDQYLHGVRTLRSFGYGFWQQAIICRDALNEANFEAGLLAMQGFKADGGDPLGITPDLLVVPPSLRSDGLSIVGVERLASGASNPNYKAAELLVTPWLG